MPTNELRRVEQELEEFGLKLEGDAAPDKLIVLDDLSGLSYRYEEVAQRISITAPDKLLATKVYNASGRPQKVSAVQNDYGAVLNYTLFSSAASNPNAQLFAFNGGSATLDARGFTPYGTFSQSGILETALNDAFEALRLNSTFTYSDPQTSTKYVVGDTINGGLAWTRPIRIGGFQIQRNFGLRPDLVTLPLPSAQGSAAVPSTVDVYINNIKTFSQDVGTGPYQISNIPAVNGGEWRKWFCTMHQGAQLKQACPFMHRLIFWRLAFWTFRSRLVCRGSPMEQPPILTLPNLWVRPVCAMGCWIGSRWPVTWRLAPASSMAAAGLRRAQVRSAWPQRRSRQAIMERAQVFRVTSHMKRRIWKIDISASSQLTFGSYNDLASVTAQLQPNSLIQPDPLGINSYINLTSSAINAAAASLFTSAQPPKVQNRFSAGVPLPFANASLSASFIQLNDAADNRSSIVSVTLSFPLPHEASFFATAFTSVDGEKNTGFLVGLSMTFGGGITASTSVSGGTGGTSVVSQVMKPLEEAPGSVGWQVQDSEGALLQRTAVVSYRSSFARIDASAGQNSDRFLGTATVQRIGCDLGWGGILCQPNQ